MYVECPKRVLRSISRGYAPSTALVERISDNITGTVALLRDSLRKGTQVREYNGDGFVEVHSGSSVIVDQYVYETVIEFDKFFRGLGELAATERPKHNED